MKYSIDFIKGLSAITEGDYQRASVHLKNAALEHSDRIEAYFAAGLVFRKNKQYDRATYVLESILRSADIDSSTKRALTVELGRVMFEAGNYTIAHSLLEMSTDREGVLLRAKTLRKLGKYEEAANTYKMLAKSEKINLDNETGYCYFRCASETEGSKQNKYLKTALKYIPKSRCVSMMQIDNLLIVAKPSKALIEIDKFINSELPASEDDITKFQSVFYDTGRTEELMRIVMKRIAEGARNPFLYSYAVSRLLHGENQAKAQELINSYIENYGFNNNIARASLTITPNSLLESYLEGADYYRCSACSASTKTYSDACPNCQGFETLKPI
ncbi:hypothetical protein ACMC5R_03245 [Deferribacteres bacterium DY0037]